MVSFSVLSLFSAGEQGAWYDPSDFSTMFQDAAGTTPVTAVEQPVGLLLDKSKGGRQSLAVTGWVKNSGDGTVTVVDNTITITGATTTTRVDIAAPGWAIGDYADITVTGSVAGATGQVLFLGGGTAYSTLSGTNTFRNVISSSTLLRLQIGTGSATYVVTSRGYVPGNHASQSTAASRPVLSARVNQLTYTEDFSNAAWNVKTNISIASGVTDPDGGSAAFTITATSAGGRLLEAAPWTNNVIGLASVWMRRRTGTGTINWEAAGVGVGDVISLTTSWQRFTVSQTVGAGGTFYYGFRLANSGDAIDIWHPDLRVTNVGVNLPAYQRVAAATDYDTSGFPLYLKFDGVDDSLATGTIDPGAVDKAQVFAGYRRLSDVGPQILLETSATAVSNAGSIAWVVPDSATNRGSYNLRGSAITAQVDSLTSAAPNTLVADTVFDLSKSTSATEILVRLNGASASTTQAGNADAGTGNFSSYPLYIGRRNNATLPFDGQVYSMILRFSAANLSDAQIASTETYVNNLTKAY